MGHVALITGGAGSGKSRYAVERAGQCGSNVLFVATCEPRDEEMNQKIARHRAARPAHWRTLEATRDVTRVLTPGFDAAVLDCLTLLVSQMLVAGTADSNILSEVSQLCKLVPYPLFIVTNEVGCGIVPENALARRFRDVAGHVNQIAAQQANEVILMVSGIPLPIKGDAWKI